MIFKKILLLRKSFPKNRLTAGPIKKIAKVSIKAVKIKKIWSKKNFLIKYFGTITKKFFTVFITINNFYRI